MQKYYKFKSPLANVRKFIGDVHEDLANFAPDSNRECYELLKGFQFLADLLEKECVIELRYNVQDVAHTARIVEIEKGENKTEIIVLSVMRGNSMVNITRQIKKKVGLAYEMNKNNLPMLFFTD